MSASYVAPLAYQPESIQVTFCAIFSRKVPGRDSAVSSSEGKTIEQYSVQKARKTVGVLALVPKGTLFEQR